MQYDGGATRCGVGARHHRPRDVLGGGVIDVRGRAGAAGVDRRDPVVARGRRGEAGVAVGDVRGAGVLDQLLPVRGAVGRPLDAVAGRRRNPLDRRRRGPGEVDLRGGVARHGVGRRRGEPGRRAGLDHRRGGEVGAGRRARAGRVDRLDPVVAGRRPEEPGVRVRRHDGGVFPAVLPHVVVGLARRERAVGAVGRDLDEVARDGAAAVVGGRAPGQHDGGVAGGLRHEPRRRVGRDRSGARIVDHRWDALHAGGEARGVVAVDVLDDARRVVAAGIGVRVGEDDALTPLDGGGDVAQPDRYSDDFDNEINIANIDPVTVGAHGERACHGKGREINNVIEQEKHG